MKLGIFIANVQVEGRAAQEHEVVYDHNKGTATCYIESDVGKEFCVAVSSKKAPTTEVQCRLFLDGNSKRACAQVVNVRRRSARLEAQRVSDVEMRRFVFSEVRTTDDENGSTEVAEGFGTIVLKLIRGESEPPRAVVDRPFKPHPAPSDSIVYNEKAIKKLSSHSTSLGSSIQARPSKKNKMSSCFNPIGSDGDATPFKSFTFVYRPRTLLRAMDLIPPPSDAEDVKLENAELLTAPISAETAKPTEYTTFTARPSGSNSHYAYNDPYHPHENAEAGSSSRPVPAPLSASKPAQVKRELSYIDLCSDDDEEEDIRDRESIDAKLQLEEARYRREAVASRSRTSSAQDVQAVAGPSNSRPDIKPIVSRTSFSGSNSKRQKVQHHEVIDLTDL